MSNIVFSIFVIGLTLMSAMVFFWLVWALRKEEERAYLRHQHIRDLVAEQMVQEYLASVTRIEEAHRREMISLGRLQMDAPAWILDEQGHRRAIDIARQLHN